MKLNCQRWPHNTHTNQRYIQVCQPQQLARQRRRLHKFQVWLTRWVKNNRKKQKQKSQKPCIQINPGQAPWWPPPQNLQTPARACSSHTSHSWTGDICLSKQLWENLSSWINADTWRHVGKFSGFFMSWLEFCASRTACWWPVKHTLDICLIIKERAHWPGVKNEFMSKQRVNAFLGHQCWCSVDDKTLFPVPSPYWYCVCVLGFFSLFFETLKEIVSLFVLCSLSDKTSNCTENHVSLEHLRVIWEAVP